MIELIVIHTRMQYFIHALYWIWSNFPHNFPQTVQLLRLERSKQKTRNEGGLTLAPLRSNESFFLFLILLVKSMQMRHNFNQMHSAASSVIPNQEPSRQSRAKSLTRGSMNVWRPTTMEPATLPQPIYMSEVGNVLKTLAYLYQTLQ